LVAACGLVDNCNGGGCCVGLHFVENEVEPAIVGVVVAATAVSDAVAYDGESAVV